MMFRKKKKVNPRRQQVRDNIATDRFSQLKAVINGPLPKAVGILIVFVVATTLVLGLKIQREIIEGEGLRALKAWPQLLSLLVIVSAISVGMSLYLYH